MSSVVTKRSLDDETMEAPPAAEPDQKRQKLIDGTTGSAEMIEEDNSSTATATKVGAKELASAFALASLAMSPSQSTASTNGSHDETTPESRDVINEGTESFEGSIMGVSSSGTWEAESPKNELVATGAVPSVSIITPDAQYPARRSPVSKRVHFAPNIKDPSRRHLSGFRKLGYPTRLVHQGQASRMPPGFAARGGGFGPPVSRGTMPPPWIRGGQRMMPGGGGPPVVGGMMPPPAMMQPNSNQWICDYCNVAAFATYQEACIHEESCRLRCQIAARRPMAATNGWHPMAASTSMAMSPHLHQHSHHHHHHHAAAIEPEHPVESLPSSKDRDWFEGAVPLAIPDSDPEWLSELNCFVRAKCVEAFSANEDDVARTSKRGRIEFRQVGIRCRFCVHRPLEAKAAAAVSYPTSVAGIYESVKRWQRVHLEVCEDTPEDIKTRLGQLGNANVWIPTTRQYWCDSAKAIGMVDTEEGIRFGSDPHGPPDTTKITAPNHHQHHDVGGPQPGDRADGNILADGDYIVFPDDVSMVPPYVYFLMRQVESCHFTEADRFVARSKGPVGYPGFQCRHCSGHAGLGKYFPVSSKSLATNSTSQNIHAHLLKCRKCPPHVKDQLLALKEEKSKAPRLEPGWRKVFFDKVWGRLHG